MTSPSNSDQYVGALQNGLDNVQISYGWPQPLIITPIDTPPFLDWIAYQTRLQRDPFIVYKSTHHVALLP